MNLKPFFNKAIPVGLAVKGLSKSNANLRKYFDTATAWGYGIGEAMDYLKDQYETSGAKDEMSRLQREESLRPDERASKARMEHERSPYNAIRQGVGLGTKLAGIGSAAMGASDILGGLSGKNESMGQQSKSPFDVLAEYSMPLAEALATQLESNRPLEQVLALLKQEGHPLSSEVKKVERATGKNFFDFAMNLFGNQIAPNQSQNAPTSSATQSTNPQTVSGDQAIIAALEKILSM